MFKPSLLLCSLSAALLIALPTQAETPTNILCTVEGLSGAYTPAQALTALGAQMDDGATLVSASNETIISAFETITTADPSMTLALAQIIAAARPDLLTELNARVTAMCPTAANQIIDQIEQAANEPTVDQLSAIAADGAAAPAAGGNDDGGSDGSPQ